MRELERDLKAFANRRRLAIVAHLKKKREARVGDIATAIKLSIKSTSKHLTILSAVNVIEKEQRSTEVFYSITAPLTPTVKYILSLL